MSSSKHPLSELPLNYPESPSKGSVAKKLRLSAPKDCLDVFGLSVASVDAIVQSWTNPDTVNFKKSNASLPSVVLVAGLDRLKFPVPEALEWGPCKILSTRTQNKAGLITITEKVTEGGSNNDAPRVGGPDKKKYYAYHLAALYAARAEENLALALPVVLAAAAAGGFCVAGLDSNAGEPGSLDIKPATKKLLYTVEDLLLIPKSKADAGENRAKARTLMHLCGNKWCLEAAHYHVGTKVFNDNQVHCHFGLHSAVTLEEYLQVQASYCKHKPKCWALPYSGVLDITAKFAETGLL